MSSDKSSSAAGGIGFFGALGIVFITLKLCGVINWSWWLVLLPLYGPPALILMVVLGFFAFAFAAAGLGACFGGLTAYFASRKYRDRR